MPPLEKSVWPKPRADAICGAWRSNRHPDGREHRNPVLADAPRVARRYQVRARARAGQDSATVDGQKRPLPGATERDEACPESHTGKAKKGLFAVERPHGKVGS